MIEFANQNERDAWAAVTTEQYFLAMVEEGYDVLQCGWLITCAMMRFEHAAKIQARRGALRVVGAEAPGDGAQS
jgi:hypothetical protein